MDSDKGHAEKLLAKHEWQYIKDTLPKPETIKNGGGQTYQIWTNVFPRKEGVTISTLRVDPVNFLIGPRTEEDISESGGSPMNPKVAYDWHGDVTKES